ncbi:MAG TPA: MFS transporter [Novosphingobium sp.]|nr:MFS transporter [Novosphingobium sp.]
MSKIPPPLAPRSPLHIADYRRFWLARCCSVLATTGMVVILGYQLYDVARNQYGYSIAQASFQLGVLGFVQFVPLFVLTPLAGVVADRFDRRHVGALSMSIDFLVALALAICTARHWLSLPLLFALAVAHGTARVFVAPSIGAIAPKIVPAELLPRAIALNSTAMQVGTIFGPALAGLLFGHAQALPYAVAAMLLGAGAVSISLIRPLPALAANRQTHPLRLVAEGFSYVRHNRFLLGCITLDLFAVLLAGATALLPVYARDILHVGPAGLGQMRAAPAIGATVFALVLSVRPLKHNVGVKMLWAVAAFGLATVVFGLSRWYPLSLAALVVMGAADMISVFVRGSLVQLATPDDMRGRVGAISGLAISASNELGEMESGMAAALMGAPAAVVVGGIGAVLVTLVWSLLFPELRLARTFSHFGPEGARREEPAAPEHPPQEVPHA